MGPVIIKIFFKTMVRFGDGIKSVIFVAGVIFYNLADQERLSLSLQRELLSHGATTVGATSLLESVGSLPGTKL